MPGYWHPELGVHGQPLGPVDEGHDIGGLCNLGLRGSSHQTALESTRSRLSWPESANRLLLLLCLERRTKAHEARSMVRRLEALIEV